MASIGIFDSGIGGLTVLKALKTTLPNEAFVYLGDTARLPYGSKSRRTIINYLNQNAAFMKKQHIKALVVACNTASTVLAPNQWPGLPAYGVIGPGAAAAAAATKTGRIGILATAATVASGAYVKALRAINPDLFTVQQACPLLVPLVEEGWERHAVCQQVVAHYLEAPLSQGIDTLILGCTHYPVLKETIAAVAGAKMTLIDSAQVIAEKLAHDLSAGNIANTSQTPVTQIWTTDISAGFQTAGERIMDPFPIQSWQLADL